MDNHNPSHPAESKAPDGFIRIAKAEDALRLAELMVAGWRNAYKHFLSREILFEKLNVERYHEGILADIQQATNNIRLFERQGHILGLSVFDHGSTRPLDSLSITSPGDSGACFHRLIALYVEPEYLGRGIGTKLIYDFENKSVSFHPEHTGPRIFTVHVFQQNLLGRKFYERHGYQLIGSPRLLEKLDAYEVHYEKLSAPGTNRR